MCVCVYEYMCTYMGVTNLGIVVLIMNHVLLYLCAYVYINSCIYNIVVTNLGIAALTMNRVLVYVCSYVYTNICIHTLVSRTWASLRLL